MSVRVIVSKDKVIISFISKIGRAIIVYIKILSS